MENESIDYKGFQNTFVILNGILKKMGVQKKAHPHVPTTKHEQSNNMSERIGQP